MVIVSQGSDRFILTTVHFNSQCHRPCSMNIFVFLYSSYCLIHLYCVFFVLFYFCILYLVFLKSDHFISTTVQFNSQCHRPFSMNIFAFLYSYTDCIFVCIIVSLHFVFCYS